MVLQRFEFGFVRLIGDGRGQMAVGNEVSYLLNIPTEHYDRDHPDELRADPFDNDFNYEWQVKSR